MQRPPINSLLFILTVFSSLSAENLSAFNCAEQAKSSTEASILNMDMLLNMPLEALLETSVSVASKTEENLAQAPGAISVITANEIERFGANSLYEVLERVVGVYQPMLIMYPQNTLSFRGDVISDFDVHVLLLLNGRPFKEGVTGGINYPIYTAFPLATIEKIEIVRGPGSVLYGTNAFSGVVNIITKQGKQLAAGTHEGQMAVSAGSFGARKVEAAFGCQDQGLTLSGGLSRWLEDGWDFRMVDEEGVSDSKKWDESNLGAYLHADYSNWNLDLGVFNSREGHLGEVPLWSWQANQADSQRLFADLGYTHEFSERWRFANQSDLQRA